MSSLTDAVGGVNLFNGRNYEFRQNRFCTRNSAIYFNNGYLQVPPGVYFSGDFTLIAWIKLNSYVNYQRILDFGNGKSPKDNIYFGFDGTSGNLIVETSISDENKLLTVSSSLELNQWYHIAFVLRGNTTYVYLNGSIVGSRDQHRPRNVTRNNNYIGKSWNSNDSYADATISDLKIFQEGMQPTDIKEDYTTSSNDGK